MAVSGRTKLILC